ncbi:AtzE family amidohydrolase [Siculibacillus lacustris]|uniref:AtzE family amidohydrolase n=1 Tax=Siculibacillus lacustris TaxID=1549641 RepID=A0A4Q9VNW1_9HYPH|nr:AtzE family amidohydrolase [Siculibacillus lacustris]TBW37362.1 AtzE family amidohydrolase [Siculibacillus lacustris]
MTADERLLGSASAIAAVVTAGRVSATAMTEAALARIARLDPGLGAFTDVTAARARATAAAIDADRDAGRPLGALAGVPFAVKNLFDVEGLPTRAGSKINRERAPASRDATLVARLEAAGAVLVGALNMGEWAYDFTGENAHDGPSRNPHDPTRMAGGSSGGCGTALAAGMVPLALGSDTNGSIRVPSSFCGVFGLKPTYGRLSRAGTFPFVSSLDHLGPFARSVADLALAFDAMQGDDRADPHLARRRPLATSTTLGGGLTGLRFGVLGDHFARNGHREAFAAVAKVAEALGRPPTVFLPEAARARAAAYVITAAEGAALHLERLRTRAGDFDPDTRDRFLAGATVPAAWVIRAQTFRRWFAEAAERLFDTVDVVIAPSTPCVAPVSGTKRLVLDGVDLPLRPNIGVYTQPISFVGLPVVAVPVWLPGAGLPIGVQIIARPWAEDVALRVAAALEAMGTVAAPVAAEEGT